ncbi:MarR family winged helix-turn-helix transcriptional regulator [Falsibacillus pallidus]|uniref:DNA-binding MarR family transcriptional regulator n=1 Tax=Falsibacillus pallidus TaxID=493781 RepID=A0A370GQB1_9BACI|nr:MarR family transcriptional regulator [Falsibacillus pallidus]RDI45905.1 DNA-binding MarR family transcriptional regulator [Falsibacillus pallidus]
MEKPFKNKAGRKAGERLGLLIWFRLSRVFNQSVKESNQHLKEWNLTTAQFDVLVQVGSHNRLSQQELAAKLLVSKGNITQLLSKMESLGYIKREQEWKTKYLSLTEKGQELFNQAVPSQEQFQAAQFDVLTRDEKKQLLNLLKKIQKG